MGKAVALALRATPTMNGCLRLGEYVPHERVNVSFLVWFEEGRNLAKARIDDLDRKSVVEATVELRELAERLRKGRDAAFNNSMDPVRALPTWAIKRLLRATQFVTRRCMARRSGGAATRIHPIGPRLLSVSADGSISLEGRESP